MTCKAKRIISDILLIAQRRLIGASIGPFNILSDVHEAYLKEWGWW